jgi:hypothetical protein
VTFARLEQRKGNPMRDLLVYLGVEMAKAAVLGIVVMTGLVLITLLH